MKALHAGPFCQAPKHRFDSLNAELLAVLVHEKGRDAVRDVGPEVLDIPSEELCGEGTNRHLFLSPPFTENPHESVPKLQIVDVQLGDFHQSKAAVDH